ncbi:hypothetical protein [Plebeiibacterium sediminum]|uniref:Uncharacterized protein n=1 Tax=Plebeiibacterium sediminum TaxID=2992112 RepID=A0AAE3M953_9BACT|nr:hypothetical protein [Plebeiobacterium sediminum]MCW3789353.1 hypothetical protein [Plebeiobacterium sediminum]
MKIKSILRYKVQDESVYISKFSDYCKYYTLIGVENPIEPMPISTQLLISESSRLLHKNIKHEIFGRYISRRSIKPIPEYKFISGLLPITFEEEQYHFGDFHSIKTKRKSLFLISLQNSINLNIIYFEDYYPNSEELYQQVYNLIKTNKRDLDS